MRIVFSIIYKLLKRKFYAWQSLTVKIYFSNLDWNHQIQYYQFKIFHGSPFLILHCKLYPILIFIMIILWLILKDLIKIIKQCLLLEYKSTRKNFMFHCTSQTVQLIDNDGQVTLAYNPRHDPNPRTVILNLRSSSIIFMFNTVVTRIVSVLKSLRFIDYNLWDPNNNL